MASLDQKQRGRWWRLRSRSLVLALGAVLALMVASSPLAIASPYPYGGDGGVCPPGYTLSDYQGTLIDSGNRYSVNCASAQAWSTLSQAPGDFLHVNVWTNSAQPFPSTIDTAINNAISNWNISGAHVRMVRVNSPYINFSNAIALTAASDKRTFETDCGHAWGVSWNGRKDDYGYIGQAFLNSNLFTGKPCSGDVTSWTGVVAHELGHAMGLGHNYYSVAFGSYVQPMFMVGGNQATFKLDNNTPYLYSAITTPPYTDVDIFNTLWPQYPHACGTSHNDYNCNGMDRTQQVCTSVYTPVSASISFGTTTVGYVNLKASSACRTNWAELVF
jgi:Dual-action HEIGH metallo-peptidase